MSDDDKLDNGRHSWGPGDIVIVDEETGLSERVGELPPRPTARERKLHLVEDAVHELDSKVARAVRARRMDSVLSRLRRRK